MSDLVFTGDVCLGDRLPTVDAALLDILRNSEFACCNFEAPVLEQMPSPAPKAGPSLSQRPHAPDTLKDWGFNGFALANNHIMDYGVAGLAATIDQLGQDQVFGAGSNADKAYAPRVLEIDGRQIALLAFAEAQFGVIDHRHTGAGYAWVNHPRARAMIRDCGDQYDFVVVQVHGGLEMLDVPLPEWRATYRELVSLGADLVIGHHPHVLQGVEYFEGKPIYYSLGNLYLRTMLPGEGGLVGVTIEGDELKTAFRTVRSTVDSISIGSEAESREQLELLSSRLDDGYEPAVAAACQQFWDETYAGYFERAVLGLGTSPGWRGLKGMMRRWASSIRNPARVATENHLLLIHNLRIESHRWAIDRALSDRVEQDA